MPTALTPRGMYFEDFEPGQTLVTAGRTITESDVVDFAGLSGDYNQIHTDAQFSQGTPYGQRVAHGLLCLSVASGLLMRTGILEGTVLAFREVIDWKFIKAVLLGDTIHAEMDVRDTKALPRIGAGSLVMGLQVKNQKDEVVMKGSFSVLVMNRPPQK
jgi:acyl dehydratase